MTENRFLLPTTGLRCSTLGGITHRVLYQNVVVLEDFTFTSLCYRINTQSIIAIKFLEKLSESIGA